MIHLSLLRDLERIRQDDILKTAARTRMVREARRGRKDPARSTLSLVPARLTHFRAAHRRQEAA